MLGTANSPFRAGRSYPIGLGLCLLLGVLGCRRPASASVETGDSDEKVWGISVGTELVFTPNRFVCTAGQKLRIVVRNTIPAAGPQISHSVVILQPNTEVDSFGRAALAASPAEDYIPATFRARVLAHSHLVGPGQVEEIRLQAPAQPGTYPVVCAFPGHCMVGMTGELVVR